jgi:beta-lactamase class A
MATDWSAVEQVVRAAEERGTVGVTVVGPDGDRWSHNGARQFKAASCVKIPLMIEIYRQIDRGERSLDDRFTLRDDEKAVGSGVMLHLHDGMEFTVNDLLYLMISISDNTATNILIDMAGMDAVNATMRELEMTGSNLGRKMKGRPAVEGEIENLATADDYVAVVEAILDGRAASAASCEAMIAMLEKQANTRRISRYLPEDDTIRWGTKTGSIKGVTNDAGFVMVGDKRLVIAVFCEGMPDQHVGEQVIGDVTRAALNTTGLVEPLYTS